MDEETLKATLHDLPLGGIRFYPKTGSTNDLALAWAANGAPDLSLVITDEQTSGRGRAGRIWHASAGSSLTFSLILRPNRIEAESALLFTGLGALALTETIEKSFGMQPQIKWPNDVLLQGRKLGGILVESVWLGNALESMVLGMGINVLSAAVPPAERLDFPAVSLEEALPSPPDRLHLLHDILASLLAWRPRLNETAFVQAWEARLAYRGEQVQVWSGTESPQSGTLIGLEADGSLQLLSPQGQSLHIHFGDVHLRPAV
ncbi:MAG: biotin--[acetyl-CoA-carboxylase] ligase [Candidatus Villigracilaceae bacterium]